MRSIAYINGEVLSNFSFLDDDLAHAYMAVIVPAVYNEKFVQGIISNPVQLTVSKNTTMLLEVSRDNSSLKHVLQGRLIHGGIGVSGKLVHIKVNDTEYLPILQTNSSGHFSREFDFQPENDQNTTYIITATFDGDTPISATAWAYTLDGQQYAACTTIQYGFEPSSNMTLVTIDPRATQLMRMTQSLDEMQKYAIDLGWLKIWGEWGWWYPWFRTNAKLGVSLNGLDLWVHIGFSPVLPDEGVIEWSSDFAQLFASLQEEALTEMFIEVGGFIAMYFAAKGLSLLGRLAQPWLIAAAAVIIIAKFSLQGVLLGVNWDDKVKMLAAGIVNTILAILVYCKINVLVLFIRSVARGMSLSVVSALQSIGESLKSTISAVSGAFSIFRDWIDIAEFVGDMVLAALSWTRFFLL